MSEVQGTGQPRPVTSGGMDRVIARKRFRRTHLVGLLAIVLSAVLLWWLLPSVGGRSLTVMDQRLQVSPVVAGVFEDSVPVRARVAPLQSVYLDAVQGGRVEEVLVEDGAMVSAGQLILRLSNSDLQLSVMSSESTVMEQLNNMRDQELRLEQNRLAHKRNLVEIDYNITRLERDIRRQKELLAQGNVAKSSYEALEDELDYYRKKRVVTLESQASDEKLMVHQLAFFKDNAAAMEKNLAYARESLQALDVRSPVAGKLSGFDMTVGQSVDRGMRLGQIDDADRFKLVAEIDEFYLSRVDIDQAVQFERDGRDYSLRVSKVYPNVEGGRFQVDMQFTSEAPDDLRRGQTIQSKLTLGDASEALLIPNGSFFQDTGGQWIFVVSPDGESAVRRPVRLGRRNADYIEVLDGLQQGERVITSPYSGYRDMQQLVLDQPIEQ
ncbi:MAG: efflux RND transporter periplasmic adaptor subunit [Halioglobus sp.]